MEQQSKTRTATIVLAVLLGVSILALVGTIAYNNLANTSTANASASVSDNLISQAGGVSPSSDETTSGTNAQTTAATTSENGTAQASSASSETPSSQASNSNSQAASSNAASTAESTTASKNAATIELYNKQAEENASFQVGDMLPGDSETKYFRVRVAYQDKVTVHCKATVRQGYEKLAEVMKAKVCLPATGEVLYDGLMRDMPDNLTQELSSKSQTTNELQYEITAYLDTSVGNEYQNKDLIADFAWWVEETGNLAPLAKTGDFLSILPWACLATACVAALALLASRRARKGGE